RGEEVKRAPPRAARPQEVAIELPEPVPERVVAESAAHLMEDHHRLGIADRLRGEVVSFPESRQRDVFAFRDVVEIALERVPSILARRLGTLLLLVRVIRAVGGETFTPVAFLDVHEDAVSPPIVQDLVPVRGVEDERESDDAIAEEGERRHPEPGLPEILDQSELRE